MATRSVTIASSVGLHARPASLFVEAVGKRYSGRYRDEDTGHSRLPRVSFWSLWNEPNQGGWLTPQFVGGKPYSPRLFRSLYIAGSDVRNLSANEVIGGVVEFADIAVRR